VGHACLLHLLSTGRADYCHHTSYLNNKHPTDRLNQPNPTQPEPTTPSRMRSMVVTRKLKDIAAAQDAELASQRAELTRLERKNFPHFPDPAAEAAAAAVGPDGRAGGGRGRRW
jgi:hypothetical protein